MDKEPMTASEVIDRLYSTINSLKEETEIKNINETNPLRVIENLKIIDLANYLLNICTGLCGEINAKQSRE